MRDKNLYFFLHVLVGDESEYINVHFDLKDDEEFCEMFKKCYGDFPLISSLPNGLLAIIH